MKRALIKTSNIDKFKKWSLLIVAIIMPCLYPVAR